MSKIYVAERSAINWLYYADVKKDNWQPIDGDNIEKGFTQTVTCSVKEPGVPITEDTQLAMPMAVPTDDWDEDDAIREALGIIGDGIVEAGNGEVTIKVRQKTERDITVYWYGR